MRDDYVVIKQLHGNKMVNLEELGRFIEKFNVLRPNQEEIEIINNPITSTEIDTVILKKNLPQNKKPRTRWLHRIILSNIQRRAKAYPSKLFQIIAEKGILPDAFYEATINLIPNPEKENTKNENYMPISLMNRGKNPQQNFSKQN